jgi:hypothetical protein
LCKAASGLARTGGDEIASTRSCCLKDDEALEALRQAPNKEARRALRWLAERVTHAESPVAEAIGGYLHDEHGLPGGADWAVEIAAALTSATRAEQ